MMPTYNFVLSCKKKKKIERAFKPCTITKICNSFCKCPNSQKSQTERDKTNILDKLIHFITPSSTKILKLILQEIINEVIMLILTHNVNLS